VLTLDRARRAAFCSSPAGLIRWRNPSILVSMPDDPQRPRTVADAVGGMRITTAVAVLGIIVLAVGSLGPWLTTFLGSVEGIRGDGKITLGAAGVAALALLLSRGRTAGIIIAGLAAFGGLGVAGYNLVHIQHAATRATLFGHQLATAGWGVYVALIGAAVAVVALALGGPRRLLGRIISVIALGGAVGAIIGAALQTQGPHPAVASIPTIRTIQTIPTIPTVPTGSTNTAGTTPPTTSSPGAVTQTTGTQPQSANQDFFMSPSGNIECDINVELGGLPDSVSCQAKSPGASVTLDANGSLKTCRGVGCLGNGPDNEYALAYGTATRLGPFTCLSTDVNGMQCKLPSGAGFQISRAGVQKL
jgi:hypothetical protein